MKPEDIDLYEGLVKRMTYLGDMLIDINAKINQMDKVVDLLVQILASANVTEYDLKKYIDKQKDKEESGVRY